MIWILWCYLGFVNLPTIAAQRAQRRTLADYGRRTHTKPVEAIQSTPQSIFQQDNSTSSSQINSLPVRGNSRGEAQQGLDERRDYATGRTEDGLAKGDFKARDKLSSNYSSTQSPRSTAYARDIEIKSTNIISNTHLPDLKDFLGVDRRSQLIKDDAESVIRRIILPSTTDHKSPTGDRGSGKEKLIENSRRIDVIDINDDSDRDKKPLERYERRPSKDDDRHYHEERTMVRDYSGDKLDKKPDEETSRRQLDDPSLDREYSKDRGPYDRDRDDYSRRRHDKNRRDYGKNEDDKDSRIRDRDIYEISKERTRDLSVRDRNDSYRHDRYRRRLSDERYRDSYDKYRSRYDNEDRHVRRKGDDGKDDRYRSSDKDPRDDRYRPSDEDRRDDRYMFSGDDGRYDRYKSSDKDRREDRYRSSDENRRDDRYRSSDDDRRDDRYRSSDDDHKDDKYRSSDDGRKDDIYRSSDDEVKDDRYRSSDDDRKDDRYKTSDDNRKDDRYRSSDEERKDDRYRSSYEDRRDDRYRSYDDRKDDRYRSTDDDRKDDKYRSSDDDRKGDKHRSSDYDDRKDDRYRSYDDDRKDNIHRSSDYDDRKDDRYRSSDDDDRRHDTRYDDSDRKRTQIKEERYDDDRYERDSVPRRYDDRDPNEESRSSISKGEVPIRERPIYLVEDKILSKSLGNRSGDDAFDRRFHLTSDDDYRSYKRRVDDTDRSYREDQYDERQREKDTSDSDNDNVDRSKGEYVRDRNRDRNYRKVDDNDGDYSRRNTGYNDKYPSDRGTSHWGSRTDDEIGDRKIEPSRTMADNRSLRVSMEKTSAYQTEPRDHDDEDKKPPRRSKYNDSHRRYSSYSKDETRVYSSRDEDQSDRRERRYDDTRIPCTKKINSFSDEPEGLPFRRIDDSDDCDENSDDKYSTRAPSSTRGYEIRRSSSSRPLTPKDIIEEAYRYDEAEKQPKAAIYPVFDPRVNNMTSEDIRPNERRGTTISTRRRKRGIVLKEENKYKEGKISIRVD